MFCSADERVPCVESEPDGRWKLEGEEMEGEVGRRMEDSGLTNALPAHRCPDYFSPGEKPFLKSNNYPSPQFSTGEICMGGKLLCAANPNTWPGGIFFEIRHLSITPNFPQCQTISPQKSIITLIQFQRTFTSEYMQGRKTYTQPTSQYPGRGRSLLVAKNQTIIHHSN